MIVVFKRMNILRKWRAKGHGIHSPFAYQLITNVIRSPHEYYAFSEIEKTLLNNNKLTRTFNRLSFRLVHHFGAKSVLEINAKDNINTKFIEAANKNVRCTSVNAPEKYDAVFIYSGDDEMPDIDTLLSLSHEQTFWVIHSIKSKQGKQFWQLALKDDRVKVTFDVTKTGIIFLQSAMHKLNYFV
jgi:hypothetical protein